MTTRRPNQAGNLRYTVVESCPIAIHLDVFGVFKVEFNDGADRGDAVELVSVYPVDFGPPNSTTRASRVLMPPNSEIVVEDFWLIHSRLNICPTDRQGQLRRRSPLPPGTIPDFS